MLNIKIQKLNFIFKISFMLIDDVLQLQNLFNFISFS